MEACRGARRQILIPGVITQSTVLVEHPELVAQRLIRFAGVVGRERVIASADCGFASFAGSNEVHPSIVWAKFKALVDGAKLASGNCGSIVDVLPLTWSRRTAVMPGQFRRRNLPRIWALPFASVRCQISSAIGLATSPRGYGRPDPRRAPSHQGHGYLPRQPVAADRSDGIDRQIAFVGLLRLFRDKNQSDRERSRRCPTAAEPAFFSL